MIQQTTNRGIPLYGIKTFLVDTKAEVINLPINCKPGSMAFVAEDSSQYILNSAFKWVKVILSGGGGGGSGEDDPTQTVVYEGGEF